MATRRNSKTRGHSIDLVDFFVRQVAGFFKRNYKTLVISLKKTGHLSNEKNNQIDTVGPDFRVIARHHTQKEALRYGSFPALEVPL